MNLFNSRQLLESPSLRLANNNLLLGGVVKLNTCRFYCSGDSIHFSVFSNAICRACYLESIAVPFGDSRIDVYTIEPSSWTRWVVIMQKERDHIRCKWFLRKGDDFMECASPDIPKKVTAEILHKFPYLAQLPSTKAA